MMSLVGYGIYGIYGRYDQPPPQTITLLRVS